MHKTLNSSGIPFNGDLINRHFSTEAWGLAEATFEAKKRHCRPPKTNLATGKEYSQSSFFGDQPSNSLIWCCNPGSSMSSRFFVIWDRYPDNCYPVLLTGSYFGVSLRELVSLSMLSKILLSGNYSSSVKNRIKYRVKPVHPHFSSIFFL